MFDDRLDEPCTQKLVDYGGKKFVSLQKDDVKLDEAVDEKEKSSKLKACTSPHRLVEREVEGSG